METFSALLAICAGNSPVPVNSPHKGQWRGALMFSLICVWINGWENSREAGDWRRHRGHYDVNVMETECISGPGLPSIRYGFGVYSAPSHYLRDWWFIVNWLNGNNVQSNLNKNKNILIDENEFENVVCKRLLISPQPNTSWCSDNIWWRRSESTLAQATGCCLTTPSRYL